MTDQNSPIKTKTEPHGRRSILGIHRNAMVDQGNVTVLQILTLSLGQLESVLNGEYTIKEILPAGKLGTCIPDGNYNKVLEYNNKSMHTTLTYSECLQAKQSAKT